jgi:diaminohydroxyphosphoribosylaminopyrimidine deaminase/5-amino-6-(5-phosphoribosylamino)uracil reductase
MMRRALREARKGRPSPNPHVGAVVVQQGRIVGMDHHRQAGLAHAEVGALQKAGERARGGTLYVTFEPCNHHGRTGPCTEAILEAGIARVVIGCRDPAPHVPGAAERLRAAGVEVEIGVRQDEAHELIADFTKHITTGRPWVTLKAAVTMDGRMATRTGDSKWITSERARREAHRLRDRHDVVLVGRGTVLADDPQLTVRHVRGTDPWRVVLDTHLQTPPSARLLQSGGVPPWICHGPGAPPERRQRLEQAGAHLLECPFSGDHVSVEHVLRELGRRDVVRVLVEGGPTLHGALLDGGWVDGSAIFVAPCIVGDTEARPLAVGRGVDRIADAWRIGRPRVRRLGADVLFEGPLGPGSQQSGGG